MRKAPLARSGKTREPYRIKESSKVSIKVRFLNWKACFVNYFFFTICTLDLEYGKF